MVQTKCHILEHTKEVNTSNILWHKITTNLIIWNKTIQAHESDQNPPLPTLHMSRSVLPQRK